MRTILRNEDGAAIIELALIAPVFALMTIGIVDVSNAYSRKLSLEQGAQRAIEKIMQTTQDLPVNDALKAEAVCQINGQSKDDKGVETCKTGLITTDDVVVTDTLECLSAAGAVVSTKTGARCPRRLRCRTNANALQIGQGHERLQADVSGSLPWLQFGRRGLQGRLVAGMRTE